MVRPEDERTALFSQLEIMSTQEAEFPCDGTQSSNIQRFAVANEGVSVRRGEHEVSAGWLTCTSTSQRVLITNYLDLSRETFKCSWLNSGGREAGLEFGESWRRQMLGEEVVIVCCSWPWEKEHEHVLYLFTEHRSERWMYCVVIQSRRVFVSQSSSYTSLQPADQSLRPSSKVIVQSQLSNRN